MTLLHGYQVWVTSKRYLYKPIVHFKCLYVYKGITSCPRHQEGYKGRAREEGTPKVPVIPMG